MANSIFAQTYLLQIVVCKLKGLQFKPFKKPDDKCAHIRDNFVQKRFLCKQFFFCCPYRKVCLSKRLSHFAQKTCYKHQHKSLPMMMINRASQKMRHRWKRHPSLDVHWHKDLQGPFKTHMIPQDPSRPSKILWTLKDPQKSSASLTIFHFLPLQFMPKDVPLMRTQKSVTCELWRQFLQAYWYQIILEAAFVLLHPSALDDFRGE